MLTDISWTIGGLNAKPSNNFPSNFLNVQHNYSSTQIT